MESIYKVSRLIKKREQSLYNALRSIYDDSVFVGEISQLWPELPLVANLRCGLWYAPHFDGTCYFKSTDGHNGNWSFSVTRLNLHVASLAGLRSGTATIVLSLVWELSVAQTLRKFNKKMSWLKGTNFNGKWVYSHATVSTKTSVLTYSWTIKKEVRKPPKRVNVIDVTQSQFNRCLTVRIFSAERGGCIIVDATRKGKRFPDSMSKTIPIWTCVINRALASLRAKDVSAASGIGFLEDLDHSSDCQEGMGVDNSAANLSPQTDRNKSRMSQAWDCSLHLPLWVSETEKNNIEILVDNWVDSLKNSGADLTPLRKLLKKPLRPLWVSQKTVIWLNEVADVASWNFTPIILVTASRPVGAPQRMSDVEFSWSYIPGAADDEESWARSLTPSLFWKNSYKLVSDGPEDCNRIVAEIVERERVYRAQRGKDPPQLKLKSGKMMSGLGEVRAGISNQNHAVAYAEATTIVCGSQQLDPKDGDVGKEDKACYHNDAQRTRSESLPLQVLKLDTTSPHSRAHFLHSASRQPPYNTTGLHWIGSTGLAVGNSECGQEEAFINVVDSVISCGAPSCSTFSDCNKSYLHLPILSSKFDRHSLETHLPEALHFARKKLANGLRLLIYCADGEDISVCVTLAVLVSCFDSTGAYCDREKSKMRTITKSDVKQTLVYLLGFHSGARPSRGNLKQVYNYFLNNTS